MYPAGCHGLSPYSKCSNNDTLGSINYKLKKSSKICKFRRRSRFRRLMLRM